MKKFLVVLIVILIIPIMVLSVVLFKKYRDSDNKYIKCIKPNNVKKENKSLVFSPHAMDQKT